MLRRLPLRRSTTIRRRWDGPVVEREPRPLARIERPGVYGPAVLSAAPKDEPAEQEFCMRTKNKPPQTFAERVHAAKVSEMDCIVCGAAERDCRTAEVTPCSAPF